MLELATYLSRDPLEVWSSEKTISQRMIMTMMSSNNNANTNNSNNNVGQLGDTALTKVFVGGLAWETPKEALREHFEKYGEILEAVIISDKLTGRSKGYGFVSIISNTNLNNKLSIYNLQTINYIYSIYIVNTTLVHSCNY